MHGHRMQVHTCSVASCWVFAYIVLLKVAPNGHLYSVSKCAWQPFHADRQQAATCTTQLQQTHKCIHGSSICPEHGSCRPPDPAKHTKLLCLMMCNLKRREPASPGQGLCGMQALHHTADLMCLHRPPMLCTLGYTRVPTCLQLHTMIQWAQALVLSCHNPQEK